jgi:hypothetical protein
MDRIYFGIRTSLVISGELPLSEQSDRLTQEDWNEVWMPGAITYQKKRRRAWNPAAFISEPSRRLSLIEPRDQSYADRWCLRNKQARVRRV